MYAVCRARLRIAVGSIFGCTVVAVLTVGTLAAAAGATSVGLPICSYPAPPPTQSAPDPDVGSVWGIGDAPYCPIDRSQLPSDYLDYVAIARHALGAGYWLATSDGRVVPAENAKSFGSMHGVALARPVVGIATTPSGEGYWLVGSDGGVFSFGDARFFGSMGGVVLNAPVVGVAATPSGGGYWLVASDGGVFTFGDARFTGAVATFGVRDDIVGVAASGTETGLWVMLNPQPPSGCQHVCT